MGYPGTLPHGLVFGEARTAVAEKLGTPAWTREQHDNWKPTPDRMIGCTFEDDKLVVVRFGKPPDYH